MQADKKLHESIKSSIEQLRKSLEIFETTLNKIQKKENKMTLTYDTKKIETTKKRNLTKKAKEFFKKNMPKEDETFIVATVREYSDNSIDVYGAYYGNESSPIDIHARSCTCIEKVFLAETLDSEAIVQFIENCSNQNLYLFKVKYKDFEIQEITSLYTGKKDDITLCIYDAHDDVTECGDALQQLGLKCVL